ncbi:MAG TPA: glycosyltransferase family 4 protein [Opitutaceae bacterium]|nr:glycosyltransferase family 4 protein [Opitutaceae bacterium]
MNSLSLLLPAAGFGVATALATWLLVGQLIRLAPQIGLLDRPNERSSHTRVTPRGGGIGFVVAISLAVAVYAAVDGGRSAVDGGQWAVGGGRLPVAGDQAPVTGRQWTVDGGRSAVGGAEELIAAVLPPGGPSAILLQPSAILVVLAAALFIAAISLRDDFRSLGAGLRFACHFAAAGAVVWAVGAFDRLGVPLAGEYPLGTVAGTGLTLLWIVGLTNVYNFMDGIDGIAGVQGVVAGLGWAVAGACLGAPTAALLGVVLAGGCAGFLVHNWSPAKIFMGDVGSAFLGFLFAVVPLVAVREAPEFAARWPVFAALAVWPFVGDGFLTFVRRLLKREKVWEAHRSHLYQRLVLTGWKHRLVSELYAGWAAAMVAVGWLWLTAARGTAALAPVAALATLGGVFLFVSRRERARRG